MRQRALLLPAVVLRVAVTVAVPALLPTVTAATGLPCSSVSVYTTCATASLSDDQISFAPSGTVSGAVTVRMICSPFPVAMYSRSRATAGASSVSASGVHAEANRASFPAPVFVFSSSFCSCVPA